MASDLKTINYSKATTATALASIEGATTNQNLTVSGKTIKPATSSLSKKITVGGGYAYDFANDYKSATITAGDGNDSITTRGTKVAVNAGEGDDTIKIYGTGTVSGGKGADTFYYESTGANVITDYTKEDTINIASSKVQTSTSGNDFILKFGKGSVKLIGGKSKTVTYIDAIGEHIYRPDPNEGIKFNSKGTGVTVTADFTSDTFNLADYQKYADKVVTIEASAVNSPLEITANKQNNKIIGTFSDDYIDGLSGADKIYGGDGNDTLIGGAGNDSLNGGYDDDSLEGGAGSDTLEGGAGSDSLWGGKGNDTLIGGEGSDVFIYRPNEGTDTITDYSSDDMLKILKSNGSDGKYSKAAFASGKLTLTIDGGGSVVFSGVKSGDTFNINGTTRTISGKTLK